MNTIEPSYLGHDKRLKWNLQQKMLRFQITCGGFLMTLIQLDPSDGRWSIILTPSQRDFEDQYNDDKLGDIVLNCQGMLKATLDIESRLDLDENTPTYIDSYTIELPTDGDLTLGLNEVEIGLENAHADQLEQMINWNKLMQQRTRRRKQED
ncbi:uncharacterized protein E6C27_scaffold684G00020 [Cucumis melo var. makuwa]|uniref:Uncharacterized protein n=1 Tax=Cucumis melo var. makuwa TaxID=1194695 RepID=A0A5A7TRT6_CUCMM|nr:uncharacterized protein E6C27_scaffold684G00020 [Cucumis melo var. makuwa]